MDASPVSQSQATIPPRIARRQNRQAEIIPPPTMPFSRRTQFPIQDEPGADGMLRIDNQRARSREAEPGADRGFSKSQRNNPVRRRKSSAGLRLGGAGSAPTAVPETRPRGARFVAALPGEDERPEPGPGDAADRPLSGQRRAPARPLPTASLSATLYPRRRGAAGHRR